MPFGVTLLVRTGGRATANIVSLFIFILKYFLLSPIVCMCGEVSTEAGDFRYPLVSCKS